LQSQQKDEKVNCRPFIDFMLDVIESSMPNCEWWFIAWFAHPFYPELNLKSYNYSKK